MLVGISNKLSMRDQRYSNVDYGQLRFWTAVLARIRQLFAEENVRSMNIALFPERMKRVAAITKEERLTRITAACDLVQGSSADRDLLRRESALGLREGEEKFAQEVEVLTSKK